MPYLERLNATYAPETETAIKQYVRTLLIERYYKNLKKNMTEIHHLLTNAFLTTVKKLWQYKRLAIAEFQPQ